MQTEIKNNIQPSLFIQMVTAHWQLQNTRFSNLLYTISDEQLSAETAPLRNTGLYILGHLTAVSDGLLPLFALGDKLYPQLQHIFIDNTDKAGIAFPSIATLKHYRKNVNNSLQKYFNKMQPGEWFSRHTAISNEEFSNDPQQNKLNVLISRTNHLSYHLGQLIYLKK